MPRIAVPFATQSYVDRSLPVSSQQLVNMYLAAKPDGSTSRTALQVTPGLKAFATAGTGPIRGCERLNEDTLIVVSGTEVYRVTASGTSTLAGSVPGSSVCSMASSGTYVFIVTENTTHWVSSTGLGQVSSFSTGGVFPAMSSVGYLDGYIIVSEANTKKFYISEPAGSLGFGTDERNFDATQFGVKSALPGDITALGVANRFLWVFGERSAELYYNSGAAAFPLTRMPSGVINVGCQARSSVRSLGGTVFWLGDDFRVYRSSGLNPQAISTSAIENKIEAGAASPEACDGFLYKQYGHTFYGLNFREFTVVYDLTTGLWHERASEGLVGNRTGWRGRAAVEFAKKRIVGDTESGGLFELDLDTFQDSGTVIRRIMVSPPLHAASRRSVMSRFTLDMETGVGLSTGQGSDPQVMLKWSDDGGHTYGDEHWVTAGAIGAFETRVSWSRLGQFTRRVMRVEISDPVKVTAIEAYAEIDGGVA